ncbi:hypothetical protein RhiirB3_470784 [Rhizophagus irregularis]|nr:hypothetical protein RhiirB3_470784 [Rhizophagus irregularis]
MSKTILVTVLLSSHTTFVELTISSKLDVLTGHSKMGVTTSDLRNSRQYNWPRHFVRRSLPPIKRYSTNANEKAHEAISKDVKMQDVFKYGGAGAGGFFSVWEMVHISITSTIKPIEKKLGKLDTLSDDVSFIKGYLSIERKTENQKTEGQAIKD